MAGQENGHVRINGVDYEVNDDLLSGREIRAAASLDPASAYVLIELRDRGTVSIGLDEKVPVPKGGSVSFRAFEGDRAYAFTFDERGFEWGQDTIAEAELRALAELEDDEDIVLDRERDETVPRGGTIALGPKGVEALYSRKVEPRQVEIFVNGRAKMVDRGPISFETVVALANLPTPPGETIYTVSYRKGPEPKPEGSLVAGQSVRVRKGMVFNVTATNRS